jgi:hypothetical protein
MIRYSIKEVIQNTASNKLFLLNVKDIEVTTCVSWLKSEGINVIDIGKELSFFIDTLKDFSYIDIVVFDHLKKLFDKHKKKISNTGNEILAVHNFGILFEPALDLNPTFLLKDFSRSAGLIIIWEYQLDSPNRLHWPSQQNNVFLDFSETPLRILHNAL